MATTTSSLVRFASNSGCDSVSTRGTLLPNLVNIAPREVAQGVEKIPKNRVFYRKIEFFRRNRLRQQNCSNIGPHDQANNVALCVRITARGRSRLCEQYLRSYWPRTVAKPGLLLCIKAQKRDKTSTGYNSACP